MCASNKMAITFKSIARASIREIRQALQTKVEDNLLKKSKIPKKKIDFKAKR